MRLSPFSVSLCDAVEWFVSLPGVWVSTGALCTSIRTNSINRACRVWSGAFIPGYPKGVGIDASCK